MSAGLEDESYVMTGAGTGVRWVAFDTANDDRDADQKL